MDTMVGWSHMGWGLMVGNMDCLDWCGMVEGGRMVDYRMVWSGMVGPMGLRQWTAIFVQVWFRKVGIFKGVGIQTVEGDGLAAVHVVPKITGELVLVEQSPVWTDEAGALRAVPPIVAHSVGLKQSIVREYA
jgi:hypothetical protein